MPRTKFSTTDLNQLRHQLDTWRQSQSGYRRLPEALWTSAAAVAATHGVGYVARSLRLDYNKLKRQVPQHPNSSALVQTSGFGRIEAIGATIRVPRDIHVRPNVAGLGIPQMAKRTIAEDLGV
jgi:hypothetical protein